MQIMIFSYIVSTLLFSALMQEWWPLLLNIPLAMFVKARANAKAARFELAKTLISQHAKELAIRKRQLVVVQNYGVIDRGAWVREIGFFIERVIVLGTGIALFDSEARDKLFPIIEAAADGVQLSNGFDETLTPFRRQACMACR